MIWLATPAIKGDTGDTLSGARVGVGCLVAVATIGEFVTAVNAEGCCPAALFCSGKKGSYVGKITCVGAEGVQDASRIAERNMVEMSFFKDMDAILPVDNHKAWK
jgi:hypothetical protein